MTGSGRRRSEVVAGLVLCGLAVAVVVFGTLELAARYRATATGENPIQALTSAAKLVPYNWLYPYKLGELMQAAGRRAQAAEYYRKALSLHRACAMCRIGLAEVAESIGEDPTEWLESASRYGASNTLVHKRAAILYARMGRNEDAAREFRAALAGRIDERAEFYSLLNRIYPAEFVIEKVVPDAALESYFGFARRQLAPEFVRAVWKRYRRGELREQTRDAYVWYLIAHGLVHDAWAAALPDRPRGDGLLDGSFEEGGGYGRFSWEILDGRKDGEGVRARIERCRDCPDGTRAVRIDFDGEHNPAYFGFKQVVPVDAGTRYRLSAHVKAEAVTSARGPALLVTGVWRSTRGASAECKFHFWGEEIRGTVAWRETALVFEVPAGCEGVRVHVARGATKRLNRLIGGTLWVDDVRLERLPGARP